MILNGNTGAHPFHQASRRVRASRARTSSGVAHKDCPIGGLEGKFSWMRQRQEWKREQERLARAAKAHAKEQRRLAREAKN